MGTLMKYSRCFSAAEEEEWEEWAVPAEEEAVASNSISNEVILISIGVKFNHLLIYSKK